MTNFVSLLIYHPYSFNICHPCLNYLRTQHTSAECWLILWMVFQQTFEQWRIVFWMLALTYMFGALVFLIFGTAKTLSWNSSSNKEESNGIPLDDSEVLKPLSSSRPNWSIIKRPKITQSSYTLNMQANY